MKEKKLKYSSLAVLPNNFLAEQSILNILLTNPLLIKKIVGKLKVESFYFEPHKLIYETIYELSEKKISINPTNLIGELQDKNLFQKIGGIERLVIIMDRFENISDLQQYIDSVNEKYVRRLIIEVGKQAIVAGYTTSEKVEIILEKYFRFVCINIKCIFLK